MDMKQKQLQEERDEVFTEVYALTNSPKQAMLAAEPALARTPHYASIKAARKLKKTDIQMKIQERLEKMSVEAVKNIKVLMQSDDEAIATQNNWRVLEHVRGKPVTRSISLHDRASIEDALFD